MEEVLRVLSGKFEGPSSLILFNSGRGYDLRTGSTEFYLASSVTIPLKGKVVTGTQNRPSAVYDLVKGTETYFGTKDTKDYWYKTGVSLQGGKVALLNFNGAIHTYQVNEDNSVTKELSFLSYAQGSERMVMRYQNGVLVVLGKTFFGWNLERKKPVALFASQEGTNYDDLVFVSDNVLATIEGKLGSQAVIKLWKIPRKREKGEVTFVYVEPFVEYNAGLSDSINTLHVLREGVLVSKGVELRLWNFRGVYDSAFGGKEAVMKNLQIPIGELDGVSKFDENRIVVLGTKSILLNVYTGNMVLLPEVNYFPRHVFQVLPSGKRERKIYECIIRRVFDSTLPRDLQKEVFDFFLLPLA